MDKVKQASANTIATIKSIDWSDVKQNILLLTWSLSGILAFSIPLIQWSIHKKEYYNAVGYQVEYENQQRYYEEQQEQYYKQQQYYYQQQQQKYYNGDDNYGYGYEYGYQHYYKKCGWWNIVCRRQQQKYAQLYMGDENQNDDGEYEFQIPGWFLFLSNQSTEEMRRWEEENTGVRQDDDDVKKTGGEIVVMTYMFLIFVSVFGFGVYSLHKRTNRSMLKWSLLFLIQLIIVNIFLLPSLIGIDDRMWDESIYGWYGQIGVLMAFFDLWVLIFAVAFLLVFYLQDKKATSSSSAADSATTTTSTSGNDEYHTMA